MKTKFQYLPYQGYAGDIYKDSVGMAFARQGEMTIAKGFAAWQKALAEYGKQQGFTIHEG